MAKLEIRADRTSCRGARACARRAPGTFALDGQRRVTVSASPRESDDAIVEAARACPNFAIEVRRDGERLA